MKEKELGLKFWAAVAVSAIGMGVVIAFVAGFFLGHFTGHHHTTTVVAAATQETTTTEESSEEGEKVTAANGITVAPKFTSEELSEEAGDNWITNGGNTTNDRFSSLDEINTENVKELKGDWMTKIGANATAAKFSAEGQALEYEGTIYISDGADDVFAMDAHNGEILWTYEPHLPPDPLGEVICCGWDNRGVAIGDGMVFVSQLNGDQVALDQETGQVKWSTPVVKPRSGFSITSAPLYYNGKVYVGGSGGEYGIRGRLTALDAETGKIAWRSYTIPGPGEKGHNTWPSNNEAWKHGGAGIWNTPTVNPKTEHALLLDLQRRTGLDRVRTRRRQPVFRLDRRDGTPKRARSNGATRWSTTTSGTYDAPSPTVLMSGEMNGETVEAVGRAGEDRLGLPARPGNRQADLPDPRGEGPAGPGEQDLGDPAGADDGTVQPDRSQPGIDRKDRRSRWPNEKPKPKIVGTKIFAPMSTDPSSINLTPNSAIGGDNWPPSSYDPEKNMYFVCSTEGAFGVIAETGQTKYNEGETFTGGEFGPTTGFSAPGFVTAYDMSTGKIAWQDKFPESLLLRDGRYRRRARLRRPEQR